MANRILDVLTACALVAGAVAFGGVLVRLPGPEPNKAVFRQLVAASHLSGSNDAAVVLLAFSNLDCGAVQRHHERLQQISERYGDEVAIAIKQFVMPINGSFGDMALAAECAGEQGAFGPFFDAAIMTSPPRSPDDVWAAVTRQTADLDDRAFRECLQTERYVAKLARDHARGVNHGVKVIPTTFVNGRGVVGAVPLATLDSLVALELGRVERGHARTWPGEVIVRVTGIPVLRRIRSRLRYGGTPRDVLRLA